MAPQTFGIEYDVVDLEGDLDGSPARPERHVPEEIAMLSGGLFDKLPRTDVPLETFFPAEYKGSPAWHRTRSDSLIPVAADGSEEPGSGPPSSRRVSPNWYVGMAAAVAMGMIAGAGAQRPSTPSLAAQPQAAIQAVAQSPAKAVLAAAVTPATPAIEAPRAPRPAPKPLLETARIPTNAARVAPIAAPAPEAAEPAVANIPVAPPPPVVAPAPEVPPQQTTAVAVAAAARGAASCFAPDELRRTMAVSVTFAPSGRATRAVIEGGPHRGTSVGSCIAQRLRAAAVKPFEGPAVTVRTSVHIR